MRRILVMVTLVVLLVLTSSPITLDTIDQHEETPVVGKLQTTSFDLSSVGGSGDLSQALGFFSREYDGQTLSLSNSYAGPTSHSSSIDLSTFWIPGWSLYGATMSVDNMTAISEHVVVGSSSTPGTGLRIWEYNTDVYYNHLSQGFYNRSHEGKLENYTATYFTLSYNTGLRGTAYFVIRSNYSISSSNVTVPYALGEHATGFEWETISGESIILSENSTYYAIIDGSDLHEDSIVFTYPSVYWGSESNSILDTRRYSTEFSSWSNPLSLEALLNYTYVPWNSTSGSALEFSNPQDIQLSANSSSLIGTEWNFETSSGNLSTIDFTSDLSLNFGYNLTLLYKQDKTTDTKWDVDSSGSVVVWNTTVLMSYPSVQGFVSGGVNLTISSDWTPLGFYNSTSPGTDYGNYVDNGLIVTCTSMTNGTWTLSNSAPNYVNNVALLHPVSRTELDVVSISENIEVNSSIRDGLSNLVTTGSTNLTVWKSSTTIWTPVNQSVNSIGTTAYLWDIDTTTSANGIYTAEIFWTNGTEAGYLTQSIIVYFPSSLAAASSHIDDYTEDTFEISVYFQDTFTPQGLDGAHGSVEYSFDGGSNTSMVDHGNGTWTATLSTAGKSPGSYGVEVYGEGFAIQNQTISITVDLLHETQPLSIQWSDGNDITYVESTELQVTYRRVSGQNVSTATLNVTIGSDTWPLTWDPANQYYSITFNGTDAPPGFGIHPLTILADGVGYQSQSDTANTLTLREEPTTLIVSWTNTNNITFVESTIIRITYRMSNTTSIPGATVNVTIGETTWPLVWNDVLKTYDVEFLGSDSPPGLGTHSLSIAASKAGYESQTDNTESLELTEEPTSIVIQWSSGSTISYVSSTILSVSYRMGNGTAIPGAVANVTIGGDDWSLIWDPESQTYNHTFDGADDPPGLGIHSLSIMIDKFGYNQNTDSSEGLIIQDESTSQLITWISSSTITFVESTTLQVRYRMSDLSAVTGAEVNVTISSTTWVLIWHAASQSYRINFNGTDSPPGFGTHSLSIMADKFGFVNQTDTNESLIIELEGTSLAVSLTPDDDITYTELSILIAEFKMSNGSPVVGAVVNVSIDSNVWTLIWNGANEDYRLQLNGTDAPPGFGFHNLVIRADTFGYVGQTNNTLNATLREEPTILFFQWSNTNNVSYVDSTILQVAYNMTDGTAISSAEVNVTIGGTTWVLNWNGGTGFFEVLFSGNDVPPGLGIHTLLIMTDYFGYESKTNNTETITLREEFTNLVVNWSSGSTITFVGSTTLSISYTMINGTPITDAVVNVTIGGTTWSLIWDPLSFTYNHTFSGMDDPPGLGSHTVQILSDRFGFESQEVPDESLIIQEESTSLEFQWSATDNITYVEYTTLSATYLMSNSTAVQGAELNVTIDSTTWVLQWNATSLAYEYTFSGTDNPPGFGTHSITVQSDKFGYVSRSNSSETLTIQLEGTNLVVSLTPDSDITYTEFSTLVVDYTMSNGSAVSGALVNVTIDGATWSLYWDGGNLDYRLQFNGTDSPPGFGEHILVVKAGVYGYVQLIDNNQNVTLREEPTNLTVQWTNGDSPGYFDFTVLQVDYAMLNGSPVASAIVNVTIDTTTWEMVWNGISGYFEIRFNGSDVPPGVGTHSLTIRSDLFGYESQIHAAETLTLPVIPTSLVLTWSNTYNITFVESTTLVANYTMFNGTAVTGAIINVTIVGTRWDLIWNAAFEVYEVTFRGDDNPPGLGSHSLTILADKLDFEGHSDSTQTLTLREESTSLVITWELPSQNNVSYLESSTLSASYTMSNGTPIIGSTVNVTIGGTTWLLLWNGGTETYDIVFNGSDSDPGFGTHSLTVIASKFGYESVADTSEELTLRVEDTNIEISWTQGSTISYVGDTVLRVNYTLRDGSPVTGATVNATIDATTWLLYWNGATECYEILFNGTDAPPSIGIHSISINTWRVNYQAYTDNSEIFTINEETTSLNISWSYGTSISYVETTVLSLNYSMSNGTAIDSAEVNVTIGGDTWSLQWDGVGEVYKIQFNGSDSLPGLGTHGLTISLDKFGYQAIVDSTQVLSISGELGSINSEWLDGDSISYLGQTTLSVNYTMSNGTAIPLATVNVTIDSTVWDLVWHSLSETYRIQFNGTDAPPGLGTHDLEIRAGRAGFDGQTDSTKTLTINDEATTLTITWSTPYSNNISYFQYTTMRARYRMSNGSDILSANLNVTIGSTTWQLWWNVSSGFYELRFNGSDSPPGLGVHSLTVQADKHGYLDLADSSESLIMRKDPTTLEVTWPTGYNLTYVEQTKVIVFYRMSNGTVIPSAIVNITIGGTTWDLSWNSTSGAYERVFYGNDDPPGLGEFVPTIMAQGSVYVAQSVNTQLVLREEPTTATPNWWSESFIYANSTVLSVEYRDSYGSLITGATQRIIIVNGTQYIMSETAGTYWYQVDYRLGMGYHTVEVNISKAGYEHSYLDSIHFNITENPTTLFVTWSSTNMDYVGQADLTVQYWDNFGFRDVTVGSVIANLSIDGSIPLLLTTVGNLWVANLTGIFLDLGSHDIVLRFWAPNYEFQQNYTQVIVSQVITDPLQITWEPTNVTIEYVQSLNLTVDYTFYGDDVPDTAIVNVTIDGTTYDLLYGVGLWSVSIPGEQLGLGVYNAAINAWLYGYTAQTNITYNVNVTLAANSFIVYWEPLDVELSFVEDVNVSVVYTYDYLPILDATVTLTLNGTRIYSLVYNATDELWHTTLQGSIIGLGIWNATVVANRTGHQTGTEWKILNVTRDQLQVYSNWILATIDYITSRSLSIRCNSSDNQAVLDASFLVEINSQTFTVLNEGAGVYSTILGPLISPGIHSVDITISGIWFYTETLNLTLTVILAPTELSIGNTNLTIYYDGAVIGNANYTLVNGSFVRGATIDILAGSAIVIPTGSSGSWSYIIQGLDLGVGNHSCKLNVSAYGFEPQSWEFNIVVLSIPTEISLTGRDWIYVNDTSVIRIQFTDSRDDSHVEAENIIITWAGGYSIELLPSGRYNITILTTGLEVGNYTFNASLTKPGHDSVVVSNIIEVRPLPLQIIVESPLLEYELEWIEVIVYLQDEYHETNVTWAMVLATFEGVEFQLEYDASVDIYSARIVLSSGYSPGEYSIMVHANATGFVDAEVGIALTILAKSTYSISIEVPSEILPNTQITVSLSLISGSDPVSGQTISLLYIVSLADGSSSFTNLTLITSSEGTVSSLVDIPSEARQIDVWVVFGGSREAWPLESEHSVVAIAPETTEPPGPLQIDPVTLTLVSGASAGALVLVLVRKRRSFGARSSRVAASTAAATSSTISSSVISTGYGIASDGGVSIPDIADSVTEFLGLSSGDASDYAAYISGLGLVTSVSLAVKTRVKPKPTGMQYEISRVKDLLRSSERGMTRAEISESLHLGIKKTREIVKQLLEDSKDFVEVQDGRRRRIAFRPER